MKAIWKYTLKVGERTVLEIPPGSKILTAQMQGDAVRLWVLVERIEQQALVINSRRNFEVYGTGLPIPDNCEYEGYIATVQQTPFVWHIFEV